MANPQVQLPGQAPLYMPNNNQQTADNAIQQPQQQQPPKIDTNDPINSLASQLVTPEEREAQEQKLLKNKRKMIAWNALFGGLANLANLYSVSKGAAPQAYSDNSQHIEAAYQDAKNRQENLFQNRDRYAQTLYNLYRQGEQDRIRNESHKAQMEWYKDRSDIAQQKAELEKYKAVRVIKNKDGSLMKFNPIDGTIEPLSEADPLYVDYMKSRTNATNRRAGLIGAPVTTTRTNAKGETVTSVRSYGSGGGGKDSSRRSGGRTIKGYVKSGGGNSKKGKGKAY